MRYKVGITGGIGSGKSIVGQILSTMGYPVFYSDAVAKQLMTENKQAREEVTRVFGDEAYTDKELNRPFLAKQIFEDESLKSKLSEIIHPKVRANFDAFFDAHDAPLVFNEAAILFETYAYKNFDYTLLVVADESIRIERVMKRDQVSKQEVLKRMENQWSDEKKINLADFVIENNAEKLVVPQVLSFIDKLSTA